MEEATGKGGLVEGMAILAGFQLFGEILVRYGRLPFPAAVVGGFGSLPGAIVGGLIIGASEKLAEVYVGPFVGGGIEGWFPYMLALAFLLVRPEGLFGEKHIDRV